MKKEPKAKIYQRLGNISDAISSISFGSVALLEQNPIFKGLFTFAYMGKSLYTGARFNEYRKSGDLHFFDEVEYLNAFGKFDRIGPFIGGIILAKGIYDSIKGESNGLYYISLGSSLLTDYLGNYFRDKHVLNIKEMKQPLNI